MNVMYDRGGIADVVRCGGLNGILLELCWPRVGTITRCDCGKSDLMYHWNGMISSRGPGPALRKLVLRVCIMFVTKLFQFLWILPQKRSLRCLMWMEHFLKVERYGAAI